MKFPRPPRRVSEGQADAGARGVRRAGGSAQLAQAVLLMRSPSGIAATLIGSRHATR
jgi:hypothetical protein